MAPPTHTWSLQARVQLVALLALAVGLIVGSVSMFHAAALQDDERVAARVEMFAKNILMSVVAEADHPHKLPTSPQPADDLPALESGAHQYQVWMNHGARLLRHHNAPHDHPFLPIEFSGYQETLVDGISHSVYSAATPDRSIVVQVAEPTPVSNVPIVWLASTYLAVALIPFLLIVLLNHVFLRRSFHPIADVAEKLNLRSPTDTQPIASANLPKEVTPLVRALNGHLRRMGHALAVETRFTSVAAHELKTPLAGIRAQAQLANLARTPEELRHALDSVLQGVDASTRVIDQLIALHRLDSVGDSDAWRHEITDLEKIQEELWAEFQPRAHEKNIAFKLASDIGNMRGHGYAIWTLLSNLTRNAIQYTPIGGRVEVKIQRRDFRVVLTVDDSGPGIAAPDRSNAMEKFNRLGRHGSDGVGLGLSIASNVATMHQAAIELLDSPLGGLRVKVQFPNTDGLDMSGQA